MADLIATEHSNIVAIANEVRELCDTNDEMTLGTIENKIGSVNSEVQTQTELINQIINELEGKASGGAQNYITLLNKSNAVFFPDGMDKILMHIYEGITIALQESFLYRVFYDGQYYNSICKVGKDIDSYPQIIFLGNTTLLSDYGSLADLFNQDIIITDQLNEDTGEPFLIFTSVLGEISCLINGQTTEELEEHEIGIELCVN
jgi:hypothetical protein